MTITAMPARVVVAAATLALLLAGCSDQLGDREGDQGSAPDKIADVDYVEVYRNIDEFPNVAKVCINGVAFATTSNRDGDGAPSLLRMTEWDSTCPGAAASTPGTATPAPEISPNATPSSS